MKDTLPRGGISGMIRGFLAKHNIGGFGEEPVEVPHVTEIPRKEVPEVLPDIEKQVQYHLAKAGFADEPEE